MTPKLPKTQAALLAAIRAGVVVRYLGADFYRLDSSNERFCTAAAKGLISKGLASRDESARRLVPVRTPGEVAQ